jgi:tetratricopeptide (TPR) repeat protein
VKAIGDKILSTLTSSEKNDFYKYYGQSLRNTNYFLEAIQILEEYISSNPTDKEALMALSESYGEIENYEKADEILERALSDNIAEGMSQKQLGDAHYDAGRLIDAKSAYNNALVLGINTDLPFWMNMGYLHFDLKEYDQATLMCDSVLKISPYDLNALNLKAYSYFNAQKLKEARAIAEQILKIKKDDANTIYFIGMTYQKADQMGKAEKYFEKAIEINPALSKQRSEKFNWDGRTQ